MAKRKKKRYVEEPVAVTLTGGGPLDGTELDVSPQDGEVRRPSHGRTARYVRDSHDHRKYVFAGYTGSRDADG